MTDEEYDTLFILLQVKILSERELEFVDDLLAGDFSNWHTLISWLHNRESVPPKSRPRMTAEDYRRHPLG